jgi:Nitroreductase family
MIRRTFVKTMTAAPALAATATGFALESPIRLEPIALPKPEKDGGKSVLAALSARKTTREIRGDALPPQMLSNLLWAAFGVNREHGPNGAAGRTAASAFNAQEIDLYVVRSEGVYLYEAGPHRLSAVVEGDLRPKVGGATGPSALRAPVKLLFVANLARYKPSVVRDAGGFDSDTVKSFYHVAAGLIGANVYLFAAAHGLAAWFHTCNTEVLTRELGLRSDQRVDFAQTVGHPA